MKRFFAWLKHAATDLHAWMVDIFTLLCSTGSQWVAGLNTDMIRTWTRREWVFRALLTFGPPILAHAATARRHQSGDDIVQKLAALTPEQRAALLVGTDVKDSGPVGSGPAAPAP